MNLRETLESAAVQWMAAFAFALIVWLLFGLGYGYMRHRKEECVFRFMQQGLELGAAQKACPW